jgi:hypothetical protein
MQIQSQELFQKLERLAEHYNGNVASPFVKAEFPTLTLSSQDWDEIELITVRQELFKHQGYHIDELYTKLLALARLVKAARTQIGAGLKRRIAVRFAGRSPSEKVMAEMSAANFLPNVKLLADQILDIFLYTKKIDTDEHQGKPHVLATMPEVREIEALLQEKVV